MTLMEKYAIAQAMLRFPALTIMVFLRTGIGYRLLNPLTLIAVNGVLAVVAILATPNNEAARPTDLLVFAMLSFCAGIYQRIRRWLELNQGIRQHSYSVGKSRLEFRWLPAFCHRNRRVARFIDPICCAIGGYVLFPYSRVLASWLIVSAFGLRVLEDVIYRRDLNRELDLVDDLIVSEEQASSVEHYEQQTTGKPQKSTSGVSTGVGADIREKIKSTMKSDPSLN